MDDTLPKSIQKIEVDSGFYVVDLDTILFITLKEGRISIKLHASEELLEIEGKEEELKFHFLNLYTKLSARRNNSNSTQVVYLEG